MIKEKEIKKTKEKPKDTKKVDDINNLIKEEYDIETIETDICLENGSFIEINIDEIEKNL